MQTTQNFDQSLQVVDSVDEDKLLRDASELESRRQKVLSLRLRRMTVVEIATAVGTDPGTVSRDLKWIRQNWRDQMMGAEGANFNPAEVLGETLAVYQEIERSAFTDYSKLGQHAHAAGIPLGKLTRTRMACLKEAREARRDAIAMLMDIGLLDRQLGTVNVNVPKAADLRKMLKDAAREGDVIEGMLVPDAEKMLTGD